MRPPSVHRAVNGPPAALLALVVLLAACSAGSGPDASDGERATIEHPTAADGAILTVESRGGFAPLEFLATQLPSFVLLGDGRVIVPGAQTLAFPGPALPPLMERSLTEEGIQEVLHAVADTGLFDGDLELRGAANFVADASDTVFTVNAGGQEVTVSVYGLGAFTPGDDVPQGISSAEVQAHAVLLRLNEQLASLDSWLPPDAWEDEGWQPYEPEALRLYVRDVSGEPVEGADVPQRQRMEWPADTDPAAFGEEDATFGDGTRCGVVEGEEAATWLQAFGRANQMTLWVRSEDDAIFTVVPRPLLPHEEPTCPEPARA